MWWNPFLSYLLPLFFLPLLLKWIRTLATAKNHPPSPPKLPIIGNLHQIGSLPHCSLHELSQKHGPLLLLHFGAKPTLVVSSEEVARKVMKTHDLEFSDRPKSTIAGKLLYDSKDVSFAPLGDYWRKIRSICVLHLFSNKMLASFRAMREEETAIMVEKIRDSCRNSPATVNLSEAIYLLTNNVVCRAALGRKYSSGEEDGRRFKRLLGELVELMGVHDVGDYIPWLRWVNKLSGLYRRADRLAEELDDFFEEVVEEHLGGEGNPSRQDFVDVLLGYQSENTGGLSIDRESIKALILDVFVGGTDTTSTALEWAMTELLRHPRALKKLQNEVRGIAKSKPSITEDDLGDMLYLKAVLKESMRLHPPLPLLVPRQSTQDVALMGYHIAVGTRVLVNMWAIGRDPSVWTDSEEFRPERFLGGSVDFRGHHFQLIPFGAGRRACPGMEFAIRVDELALANLMLWFDFDLPDGVGPDGVDMSVIAGMTVHKRIPLLAIVSLANPLVSA